MTLGNAAAAHVRFFVWCKACGHRSEPDPAEQARWYGAETPVLAWRAQLVLLGPRQPGYRHGVHRREAIAGGLAKSERLMRGSEDRSRPFPDLPRHAFYRDAVPGPAGAEGPQLRISCSFALFSSDSPRAPGHFASSRKAAATSLSCPRGP